MGPWLEITVKVFKLKKSLNVFYSWRDNSSKHHWIIVSSEYIRWLYLDLPTMTIIEIWGAQCTNLCMLKGTVGSWYKYILTMVWGSKHFKGRYLRYDWSHGGDCQLDPSVWVLWSKVNWRVIYSTLVWDLFSGKVWQQTEMALMSPIKQVGCLIALFNWNSLTRFP